VRQTVRMFGVGMPEIALISVVCLVLGVLMGRPYGRGLEGAVWGFFLGPLGLLVFALFMWRDRRHAAAHPPPRGTALEREEVPVEVYLDEAWHPGTMRHLDMSGTNWRAMVEFPPGSPYEANWFPTEQVRRTGAAPR
jgi:hypothetical protein